MHAGEIDATFFVQRRSFVSSQRICELSFNGFIILIQEEQWRSA